MSNLKMEQLIKQLESLRIFNLDNSFEISFTKQFMFPYSGIDFVMQNFTEYEGNAIYMILQADRLELTNVDLNHDLPVIEYRNSATSEIHRLDNLWFFPYVIPREWLHMKIISSSIIEIGIKDTWRQSNPNLGQYIPTQINIYDLVTQSRRDFETASEYNLLYIGSSKEVYKRLCNHKTILKIYRHTTSMHPDKEIFAWILKPEPKFHKQISGGYNNILLSSSIQHPKSIFNTDVEPNNLLQITEAMLINYFKPEYNDHYVKKAPNALQEVYTKLYNAGVKNIQVNLNLFMQAYKDILFIKTEELNTNKTKH